jgi:CheY-like chemotaxis protein
VGALLGRAFVEEEIVLVKMDRNAKDAPRQRDPGYVIDVGMRQEDVSDAERPAFGGAEQALDLVAGIDQHGLARLIASDEEPVLEERTDRVGLDYDHGVILAILDDLMFTSKIRATASQLGVPVTFVRSSDAALAEMRRNRPALVILDLNNARTDPLGTVAAMKADPTLEDIPTVGFASHVQTDVIEASRRAGVGDVMARSLFTVRLPDILAAAK